MPPTELDSVDQRILRQLQADGRLSNVELAERIHLSAPQCLRRVRSLEERGVIQRYAALVNAAAINLQVMAFVSLAIERDQSKRARDIERLIRDLPEVIECHTISGDFDYLLKVVAADLKALSTFLTDRLMQIPGVASTRSTICLEEIKPFSPLPVDQSAG